MLDQYKAICISEADAIPNWRGMTKNELLNKYVEFQETNPILASSYMAAVMVKYWPVITKYWLENYQSAKIEDCYDWFTHSLLYGTGHRANHVVRDSEGKAVGINLVKPSWIDSKKSISKDINGADKVINRCFKSSREIYFQANNAHNRRLNLIVDSLERIKTAAEEQDMLPIDNNDMVTTLWLKELIKNAFKKHDSFRAFAIDGIIHGDVFDHERVAPQIVNRTDHDNPYETILYFNKTEKGVLIKPKKEDDIKDFFKYQFFPDNIKFNPKKLLKHIKYLDEHYCKIFSNTYGLNYNEVLEEASKVSKYTSVKLHKRLNFVLSDLRQDAEEGLIC